jgi:hypothetical protein
VDWRIGYGKKVKKRRLFRIVFGVFDLKEDSWGFGFIAIVISNV